MTNTKQSSYAASRKAANIAIYVILAIMSLVWIFPIVWLVMQSFRKEPGVVDYLIPHQFTMDNYVNLFKTPEWPFGTWFLNTLVVAIFSCVISTLIVLMVSYAFSRLRFKSRKTFLNIGLVLGMFPGFMSMAATYNLMKAIGLDGQLPALVIVYSAGAGLGYHPSSAF